MIVQTKSKDTRSNHRAMHLRAPGPHLGQHKAPHKQACILYSRRQHMHQEWKTLQFTHVYLPCARKLRLLPRQYDGVQDKPACPKIPSKGFERDGKRCTLNLHNPSCTICL